MNFDDYQQIASKTIPPTAKNQTTKLDQAIRGLCSESGELMGVMEKWYYQGHDAPHKIELVDELGDVLWYLAEAAEALGVGLDFIARWNVEKLKNRYPDGRFDTDASIQRKVPEEHTEIHSAGVTDSPTDTGASKRTQSQEYTRAELVEQCEEEGIQEE